MRFNRKFFGVFMLAASTILLCELLAFAFLTLLDVKRGESAETALGARLRELALAWKPAILFGSFDPVLLVRHEPGSKYGRLNVNEEGFIGNGHDDRILNTFPEKPENVFRIVLLGGSSAAGTGVDRNDQTIAAQLETALNRDRPRPRDYIFQVLNFGAAGGHSGPELLKFLTQIVYTRPDMVICLDGYNDAAGAVYLYLRHKIEHAVINWGDPHYSYFELLNGYDVSEFMRPRKFLTFTFMLAGKLSRKIAEVQGQKLALYGRLPLYRLSAKVEEDYPYFENVLYKNLDAFAAYAAFNKLYFLGYFQPVALKGKRLTAKERAGVESYYQNHKLFDRGKMRAALEAYAGVYAALDEKYRGHRNIRFRNITALFNEVREDIYIDDVHYNEIGNRLLAQRFYQDIREMLRSP